MQESQARTRPGFGSAGFTLVELMMVVAMLGILTTIAVPSYRDYIVRSAITDATSNLSTRRVALEQFFQDSRTYVGAPACTADSTTSKYFDFSCSTQTATAYTIQAQGKTGSMMAGFTFTLDQANARATTAVPSGWTRNSPDNCWVIRKGGVPCG